jgi:hypothetical protein
MLSTSLMPLGMLIFGPLAEVVTIETLLLVTGAPTILLGVTAPLYRRLMAFGEPVPSANNLAAQELVTKSHEAGYRHDCPKVNDRFGEMFYPTNHSSRVMPARLMILESRSALMGSRCRLGIVRTRSCLIMYGCFPPWKGPSKPNECSLFTSTVQDSGASLATYG